MADVSLKRQREDSHNPHIVEDNEEEASKKIKSSSYNYVSSSYNYVLSLLEEDDDGSEPSQDLNSLLTSLEHELSYEAGFVPSKSSSATTADTNVARQQQQEEEEDKERIIRHLLDASDDELGIPNRVHDDNGVINGGEDSIFSSPELLWEMEDEAANYYTLLQSELFM